MLLLKGEREFGMKATIANTLHTNVSNKIFDNKYLVQSLINRGSFGTVFKVINIQTNEC